MRHVTTPRKQGLPRLPRGLGEVIPVHSLGGGQVGQVWQARLSDGTRVVVKATGYDARLEAEGLAALAAAGGSVPQVLAVEADLLVLTDVSGPPDWEGLGRGLARVHRTQGPRFGWVRDNVIGPLPQLNPWTDDWPTFYVEHRLRPYLGDLPRDLSSRLDRLCDRVLPDLLAHGAPPSLVHGDLWSGNIVDGRALIDPAVHHADRELDFAMLALFGGIPRRLLDAYEEVWPLEAGHDRRRPALQLYHLLVHVRLFGSGYLAGVEKRLDLLEGPGRR